VRGNMPPKKTPQPSMADVLQQLADVKKQLANGGAAADAADANTNGDGDPEPVTGSAKPVAGSEKSILTTLTEGIEELGPLMGDWFKRTASKWKNDVKTALKDPQLPAPAPVKRLEAPPQPEQDALATRVEQMENALLQSTNLMQQLMEQHQQPTGIVGFQEDDDVYCIWKKPGNQWDGYPYKAIVTAVHDNHTYSVRFTQDNETRVNVPHNELSVNRTKRLNEDDSTRPTKAIKVEPTWSVQLKLGKLNLHKAPLPSVGELRRHNIAALDLYNWMACVGFKCGKYNAKTREELFELRASYPNRDRLNPGECVSWD